LVGRVTQLAGDDKFKFMEVCGGHTHTIYRHGIEHLLPESVELVHGPGCPVCVIPMGRVDDAIAVAKQPGVIFTSFGDMMRVPGSQGNLLQAKAEGADVRFVYSPLDALRIAVDDPARQVVFFAVGFETTAPSTALTLLQARDRGVPNFTVFSNHVTIVPPIKAILESPDLRLDGFLGPGHVSTVIGQRPYRFVPAQYHKPLVTAGFEPLDILQAIAMLLTQIREGRCQVENQYSRVVRDEGNPRALAVLAEVFELRPHFEWRGLGFISQSALRLRPEFGDFDAELRYHIPGVRVADPKACQCGEVLKGVIKPWECKVFGTACTPETPIGTCMVSSEGACAAYYNFGRMHRDAAVTLGRKPVLST
jgi:hydrogenase expression/formation protein HypD